MSEPTDFDGAWKETIERFLRPLLELAFPEAAAGIDWSVPTEFLDQELQEVVRGADLGKQRVDKLVNVRRLDGTDEWVLLHLEVQSQPDDSLPLRLYQYHHRIVDRFGRKAVTLVLLADERPNWRPAAHEEDLWGCRLRFEYPVCKLLDLEREGRLENSDNPVALVAAAHLAAQATGDDMERRRRVKWSLTRRLFERGYNRQDVLELFRLIDWLMVLPKELEIDFRKEVREYQQQNIMPFVTSFERLAREEGREEGLEEGLEKGREEGVTRLLRRQLQRRFGDLPGWVEERFAGASPEELEQWGERVLDAVILEDVFA